MNIEQLEKSGMIMCKLLTGSRAYGTAIDTDSYHSDFDYRGVFLRPLSDRITTKQLPTEVGQESPEDVKYYELEKFFALAKDASPNIIELIFMPDDCIKKTTPAWDHVLKHRGLFVSQKAFHTFSGYAFAQIKKMRGQNKFVNNPMPEDKPKREDFCWIIPASHMNNKKQPCRPVPYQELLSGCEYNRQVYRLDACKVAGLEHGKDVYRLYRDDEKTSKGVFRDGNLVCGSISLEDEKYFIGLLIYAEDAYEKAVSQWTGYWDWVKNRNQNRWVDQERGVVDYDAKNALHCIRLLMSGEAILRTGEPIVRFAGAELDYLMNIRAGNVPYETLMADVERRMAELETVKAESKLPRDADEKGIEQLFRSLILLEW